MQVLPPSPRIQRPPRRLHSFIKGDTLHFDVPPWQSARAGALRTALINLNRPNRGGSNSRPRPRRPALPLQPHKPPTAAMTAAAERVAAAAAAAAAS
jgi:hypothetical protein